MSHIGMRQCGWPFFLALVGCMLEIKVQGGWATKKSIYEKKIGSLGLNSFFCGQLVHPGGGNDSELHAVGHSTVLMQLWSGLICQASI